MNSTFFRNMHPASAMSSVSYNPGTDELESSGMESLKIRDE